MEADRWISVLSDSFCAHCVAPLALLRPGRDTEEGWLGRLAATRNCAAVLSLSALKPTALADVTAGALRADIARSGPRFTMIIDPDLRQRRALSHRLPSDLPSPLDLLGWAVALRKKDVARHRGGHRRPYRCRRRWGFSASAATLTESTSLSSASFVISSPG